jgi:hypothetical protein
MLTIAEQWEQQAMERGIERGNRKGNRARRSTAAEAVVDLALRSLAALGREPARRRCDRSAWRRGRSACSTHPTLDAVFVERSGTPPFCDGPTAFLCRGRCEWITPTGLWGNRCWTLANSVTVHTASPARTAGTPPPSPGIQRHTPQRSTRSTANRSTPSAWLTSRCMRPWLEAAIWPIARAGTGFIADRPQPELPRLRCSDLNSRDDCDAVPCFTGSGSWIGTLAEKTDREVAILSVTSTASNNPPTVGQKPPEIHILSPNYLGIRLGACDCCRCVVKHLFGDTCLELAALVNLPEQV